MAGEAPPPLWTPPAADADDDLEALTKAAKSDLSITQVQGVDADSIVSSCLDDFILERLDPEGVEIWYRVLEGADVGLRLSPSFDHRHAGGLRGGTIFHSIERVAAEGLTLTLTLIGLSSIQ